MRSSVARFLNNRRDVSTSVSLGLLSFLLFIPFARLDFDLHHDGYMTAAARAVSSGRAIHREVFMQYGPLLTILQSIVAALPTPPTLSVRILNALFLALAIGLIADMGRRSPAWLGISRLGSHCAALLILIFADFFFGAPMLPWPSTLLVLLLVAHYYLLIVGLYFAEKLDQRRGRLHLTLSGITLGLVFFVRPMIFLALIAGLLLLILMGLWTHQTILRAITRSVLNALLLVGLGVLALMILRALKPWWSQNFAWSASYLDQSSEWTNAAAAQIRTYSKLFVFLTVGTVLGVIVARIPFIGRIVRQVLGAGLIVGLLGGSLLFVHRRPGHNMLVAASQIDLPIFALLVVTYWVMVAVTVIAASVCLMMLIARKSSSRLLMVLWACGISAVSLTQSFPVPDSRHYYWAIASAMVLVPLLTGFIRSIPRQVLLFGAVIVALISAASSIHVTIDYLQLPRIAGPAGAINESMLSSPVGETFLANFNESYEFLSRVIPEGESALFLTPDGANAAFDGDYRSADAWFVNWGPVPPLGERLAGVRFVVADFALSEQDLTVLVDAGFIESASTDRLRFFERADSSGG